MRGLGWLLLPMLTLAVPSLADDPLNGIQPRDQFVGPVAPLILSDVAVVVGLVRTITPPSTEMPVSLVGLDAQTLQERWRVGGIGDAGVDAVHLFTHLGRLDALIVVAQANRVVRGVRADTGEVAWTVPLSDVPSKLCVLDDVAYVQVVDGQHRRIGATGSSQASPSWPAACGRFEVALPSPSGPFATPAWPQDSEGPQLDGVPSAVAVDRILQDPSPGPAVVLLHKKVGTAVPHVGAAREGRLLWHRALVTADPFGPMAEVPEHVVLGDGGQVAVIGYRLRLGQVRLQAMDRTTGAVLWDVAVPHAEHAIDSLSILGDRVYVGHWTYLDALDLKTGESAGSFGVW